MFTSLRHHKNVSPVFILKYYEISLCTLFFVVVVVHFSNSTVVHGVDFCDSNFPGFYSQIRNYLTGSIDYKIGFQCFTFFYNNVYLLFIKGSNPNISQSSESTVFGAVNDNQILPTEDDYGNTVEDKIFSNVKGEYHINNTTKFNGSINYVDKSEDNYFENDRTEVSR